MSVWSAKDTMARAGRKIYMRAESVSDCKCCVPCRLEYSLQDHDGVVVDDDDDVKTKRLPTLPAHQAVYWVTHKGSI